MGFAFFGTVVLAVEEAAVPHAARRMADPVITATRLIETTLINTFLKPSGVEVTEPVYLL